MKLWFSDVLKFQRDPLGFLLEKGVCATEPLVPLALGFRDVYLVADCDLVKPILKADESDIDKGRLVHKLRPIVGKSSLTISGFEHHRRRDAVGAQLARGRVEALVPMMAAEIRRFAAHIAAELSVDVDKAVPVLALKLIAVALFGHHVLAPEDEHALVMAVRAVEDELADDMFRVLPLTPWTAAARKKRRDVARAAMSVVVRHVKTKAAETSVLKNLETLGLDGEAIRDEILTMLLAGHHTTGSAVAWVLYHMATEPGLADALAVEAAQISNSAGELQPELVKNASLSLTLAREVLRLYPSSWWYSREVQRPFAIGGRTLSPGTSLLISPWHMHRDPRYWTSPDQFRLDRAYTSRAYIPFGAGPRACVGMGVALLELQLIALEIASAYSLTSAVALPVPKPRASLTLLPPTITIDFQMRQRAISSQDSAA